MVSVILPHYNGDPSAAHGRTEGGAALEVNENPSNANVYAGDACYTGTGAGGSRTVAIRVVNDALTCQHRTAWEVAPGGSYTVYYRTFTTGGSPPALPSGDADDVCKIEAYEDNTGTVLQTFRSATTCPANQASFTGWCTTNGASGGTPYAGTLRLRIEAIDKTAGVPTGLNGNSDTAVNKGAIRCGMDVTSISYNSYPAGSTFAYTVAGETMTCTVAHTRAPANQVRTAVIKTTDGSDASIQSSSFTITSAATSSAASFTLSDAYPAAATTGGCQFDGFGNSVLTGVHWTHINAVTSPVTAPDSYTARRSAFFAFDPRVTVTHLVQVNSASFATPPMSADIGTTRTLPDVGYIATRFTNARGEGLTGSTLAYTRTLQDHAHVLSADSLTCTSSCIGTQGGQAGWGSLFLWNAGGPIGQWDKAVDITGPSTIDSDSHLISGTQTLTLALPDDAGGFPGDPLDVDCADTARPGGVIGCTITASLIDGSARTGDAAHIAVNVYNPSNTAVATAQTVTEIGSYGVYRYSYTLGSSPAEGRWIVLAYTDDAAIVSRADAVMVETDGTLALLTDTATIKGYTDQVEDYVDQVEGYTDTLEASAATAATAHAAAATAHANLQADTDDIQATLAAHDVAVLDALEAASILSSDEHQEILDAISAVQLGGNYTNATLAGFLADFHQHDLNQTEHRDNSMEIFGMSFNNLDFDGFLYLLLWFGVLLFCLVRSRVFAGFVATMGLLDVLIPDIMPGSPLFYFFLLVLAVWLEAIAGEKIYAKWLNKNSKGET